MKLQLIKSEHFSLIEYARHVKMQDSRKFSKDFHYKFIQSDKKIDISNFEVLENEFVKYIPSREKNIYLQVFKSKKSFQQKAKKLKIKIIFTQLFLLLIFAFISYFLAKNALKPLNDSIDTLDKFAKDLIHDLNTPVTAMQLNMKILEKNGICVENKAFNRLKKSVESILELHISLKTLLENKTFQLRKINLCNLINDVIELHQINYKNLNFIVKCTDFEVNANEHAIKQILHNLISNACKYNRDNGYIKIYTKDNTLYIEDSGIGIKNPELIFNREYSTQNSSGLGLDIVKRLCDAMNIDIKVVSNLDGSCFSLKF